MEKTGATGKPRILDKEIMGEEEEETNPWMLSSLYSVS
jgi:hypothetical protein